MPPSRLPKLTPEQRAVVRHEQGPALVFAVAGAGKTTAMVHRLKRLVRQGVFPAERILATSFSRATVAEIRRTLEPWTHCAGVQTSTLHALGYRVLREAAVRGRGRTFTRPDPGADPALLRRTLARARSLRLEFVPELEDLDPEDFLAYVGACKGNLLYADLEERQLPAGSGAAQAHAPPDRPWYLDLYRLFEHVRRETGILTFDDLLLGSWEALVRDPELLEASREGLSCVVVDEFQDVSRAQTEILDLLTQPHRNYMVIGDDDQTIYEWRGASPEFILDFQRRYGAVEYLICDSFRCPAGPLALANRVIERNRRRRSKRLSLTRGFQGGVQIHFENGPKDVGRRVGREIEAALKAGRSPTDLAVLVRIFAQTVPVEHCLIEAGIPYRVVGAPPFYGRAEILTLLHYLRLGQLEREWKREGRLAPARRKKLGTLWMSVYSRPNRYLSRALAREIRDRMMAQGRGLAAALHGTAAAVGAAWLQSRVREIAGLVQWLCSEFDRLSAGQLLRELDTRLGYRDYLRHSSGFREWGDAKAASVDAVIRYAGDKGRPEAFLSHMEKLYTDNVGKPVDETTSGVILTTVFRAKGLEWPIVLVPNCNDGTIPWTASVEGGGMEEERRLLYVALTRAVETVHLVIDRRLKMSPFLKEASYRKVLEGVETARRALDSEPEEWGVEETLAVAMHSADLGLPRYLAHWWDVTGREERASGVARTVCRLYEAVRKRGGEVRLGLPSDVQDLWEDLLDPESEIEDWFPGLDQLVTSAAPPPRPRPREKQPQVFRKGDFVWHGAHGLGKVVEVEIDGARVIVKFLSRSFEPTAVDARELERRYEGS